MEIIIFSIRGIPHFHFINGNTELTEYQGQEVQARRGGGKEEGVSEQGCISPA